MKEKVTVLDELMVCQSKISLMADFFNQKDIPEMCDYTQTGLAVLLHEVMKSLSNIYKIIECDNGGKDRNRAMKSLSDIRKIIELENSKKDHSGIKKSLSDIRNIIESESNKRDHKRQ